jgi:hypothetical protein
MHARLRATVEAGSRSSFSSRSPGERAAAEWR